MGRAVAGASPGFPQMPRGGKIGSRLVEPDLAFLRHRLPPRSSVEHGFPRRSIEKTP